MTYGHCDQHDKPFEWIKTSEGKSVHRCPDCHAGIRATDKRKKLDIPLIKFGQNFFRCREYSEREKKLPGGKARKPKW